MKKNMHVPVPCQATGAAGSIEASGGKLNDPAVADDLQMPAFQDKITSEQYEVQFFVVAKIITYDAIGREFA